MTNFRVSHFIVKLGMLAAFLITGITAAIIAIDRNNAENEFREYIDQQVSALSLHLGNADATLSGVASLLQAKQALNIAELTTFSQEVLKQSPYIDHILYLPKIDASLRDDLEAEMRTSGFPMFQISDRTANRMVRAPQRSAYFPVTFIEPMTPASARLIGFDASSLPSLRQPTMAAIQNGGIAISPPVNLIDTPSLWAFKAVYHGYERPEDAEGRENHLRSLAAIQLNLNRLVADLFADRPQLKLSLSFNPAEGSSSMPVIGGRNTDAPPSPGLLPPLTYVKEIPYHNANLSFGFEAPLPYARVRFPLILFLDGLVAILILTLGYNRFQRFIAEAHEQQSHKEVLALQERAQITLHSIGDAVITTDTCGRVEYMNPVAEHLTGWNLAEAKGRGLKELFTLINEVDQAPIPCPVEKCLNDHRYRQEDEHVLLLRNDGETIPVDESVAPIHTPETGTSGVVLVLRDVSVERHLTSRLTYQATHDSLTGLSNRRDFEENLKHVLRKAQDDHSQHALLYLDLDQFKFVNDSVGHLAGDQLLKQIASALRVQVRRADLLARFGGDEFAILLKQCPPDDATEIAKKICKGVSDIHFHWQDKLFNISVSIGVVMIDHSGGDLTSTLSAADSACFIAKDLGRNRFHVYQPDDKEISRRRLEIQSMHHIRYALKHDAMSLCLQPIVPSRHNTHGAFMGEFLVRMRDREGNPVLPFAFIPTAERYSMMKSIDQWVVRHAMQRIAADYAEGPGDNRQPCDIYTINLSGQSLDDPEMIDFISRSAKEQGIDTGRVCFEITETAAITNLEQALEMINRLREQGFLFALDDFGTGLSSFSYLKKLPVDFLKIDGEFVRDMEHDQVDQAMVETINQIAHVLNIRTIAEFVENENLLGMLEEIGVDYLQGYHLGRPEPVSLPLDRSHQLTAVGS